MYFYKSEFIPPPARLCLLEVGDFFAENVKISNGFSRSVPNPQKMQEYREIYEKTGRYDNIIINSNNVLIDGYIRYLILKEHGVDCAVVMREIKPVMYCNNDNSECKSKMKNLTYVWGKHVGQITDKEYVWYIKPKKVKELNIHVGDVVMCATKYGRAPVVVSRVERLEESPVDGKIKPVVKKVEQLCEV